MKLNLRETVLKQINAKISWFTVFVLCCIVLYNDSWISSEQSSLSNNNMITLILKVFWLDTTGVGTQSFHTLDEYTNHYACLNHYTVLTFSQFHTFIFLACWSVVWSFTIGLSKGNWSWSACKENPTQGIETSFWFLNDRNDLKTKCTSLSQQTCVRWVCGNINKKIYIVIRLYFYYLTHLGFFPTIWHIQVFFYYLTYLVFFLLFDTSGFFPTILHIWFFFYYLTHLDFFLLFYTSGFFSTIWHIWGLFLLFDTSGVCSYYLTHLVFFYYLTHLGFFLLFDTSRFCSTIWHI